jgi:hypothetical protein
MTSYDAEIICRLYTALDRYDELDGLFTWEFMSKIAEEFKGSEWEQLDMDIDEALKQYAEDNIDRWIRKLNGDHVYKIKAVLELDVVANKKISIDNIISQLDESIYVNDDGETWSLQDRRIINAVGKEVDE